MATVPASFNEHGQSTLKDGRMMISGGTGPRNGTYIYNSDSDIWVSASPMPASFYAHGQSVLNDGRILVSGGYAYRSTVYIYTPDRNIWSNASPMPAGFQSHGQATVDDGRVLVSGGTSNSTTVRKNTYIYTPNLNNDLWISASPMPVGLVRHNQSTLFDGRALISGGKTTTSDTSATNTVYVYDAVNDLWANVPPMPASIIAHAQSTLADGRVLISGGWNSSGSALSTAYIYTPAGWEEKQNKKLYIESSTDVEQVPFNRGFFTVDVEFFFKVKIEAFRGLSNPTEVEGLCMFDKKVVLFGSEGNAKIFQSKFNPEAPVSKMWQKNNLPIAVVEVVDPVALAAKLVNDDDCCCDNLLISVPENISEVFAGGLVTDSNGKQVFVSLGLFSIIKLERTVQLLVRAIDFCVPERGCAEATAENPFRLFDRLRFPTDEFFPPQIGAFNDNEPSTNFYCRN